RRMVACACMRRPRRCHGERRARAADRERSRLEREQRGRAVDPDDPRPAAHVEGEARNAGVDAEAARARRLHVHEAAGPGGAREVVPISRSVAGAIGRLTTAPPPRAGLSWPPVGAELESPSGRSAGVKAARWTLRA